MIKINSIFRDNVNWSFHTTMNLDMLYQAMIMGEQMAAGLNQPNDEMIMGIALMPDNKDKIAFFYNSYTEKNLSGIGIKKIPVDNTNTFSYPLECKIDYVREYTDEKYTDSIKGNNNKQTFHTKLSFICYSSEDQEKYRLVIYTKNMTFASSCLELAASFDIKINEIAGHNENGMQLQSFLNKIYRSTSSEGKLWLENHKLNPGGELYDRLRNIELEDEISKRHVSIYFGGCGNEPLFKKIGLDNPVLCPSNTDRTDSIVITPPFFVSQTCRDNKESNCQKYLKGILYDLKAGHDMIWTSSHAKAYLMKIGDEYSFLFGSANCTPEGLGWNFIPERSGEIKQQSVECLVKYTLDKEEYDKLKEKILNYYEAFDFTYGVASLIPVSDFFGEIFSKYGTVTNVTYDTDDGKINGNTMLKAIRYSIKIAVNDELKAKIDNMLKEENTVKFYPAEYSKPCSATLKFEEVSGEAENEKRILKTELIYKQYGPDNKEKTFKFEKCQQTLVIGKSNAVLSIDGLLVRDIPKPEGVYESLNDIYLTKAIKDFDDIKEAKNYLEQQIKRINNIKTRDNEINNKKLTILEDLKHLQMIFE